MVDVISVKDVSFSFANGAKIIDDISFSSGEYEFVSIIGPSGCGKSTLLRIMAGLIKPTKGHIFYYGKEFSSPIKEISFVFQDFALLPWLTNEDNVKLGLSSYDMTDEEKTKKADDMLKKLELNGFENGYPNILSGGMKQRVGVARALVSDPKVLLMDEPFSSLDELTARSLRSEVLYTLKDKSLPLMSVIMVTHNVEEAVELSDKIVVLSNKPSKVREIKTVTLPSPRNRHSKEFQNLVDEVYASLTF
jgi:NitT/TauT family transport system ATP-binding protein